MQHAYGQPGRLHSCCLQLVDELERCSGLARVRPADLVRTAYEKLMAVHIHQQLAREVENESRLLAISDAATDISTASVIFSETGASKQTLAFKYNVPMPRLSLE